MFSNEKSPCKDCPDRVLGCHGTCERYAAFKQRLEEMYKRRQDMIRWNSANVIPRKVPKKP